MSCGICGEYRFTSKAQGACHISLNHASYGCGCGRRFMASGSLTQHKHARLDNKKEYPCTNDCCKSFSSLQGLNQHRYDKGHSSGDDDKQCPCSKEFDSNESMIKHLAQKKAELNFNPCLTCTKTFPSNAQLHQHWKDTDHETKADQKQDLKGKLQTYLDGYYKHATMVPKQAKGVAVKKVHDVLHDLLEHARKQDGSAIYGNDARKAGSHSTNTKIKHADEFDFDIPLKVNVATIETRGKFGYKFQESKQIGVKKSNLNVTRDLEEVPRDKQDDIPVGYAVVKLDDSNISSCERVSYKGHIISRHIQTDLYRKLKDGIKALDFKDVDLSRDSHGPAVTLTIKPETGHHISVDISPCISSAPKLLSEYGWPRPDTQKCLPAKKIEELKEVGTHLVPKDDRFWYISFSRAEKELMNGIDSGNEVRRKCHKMLKADFQKWQSQSTDGFPGVSTQIFKHQMFWMNETHREPAYWAESNLATCYTDMLKELKFRLDHAKMPNYFNPLENFLKTKDKAVLHKLAQNVHRRREELVHINC